MVHTHTNIEEAMKYTHCKPTKYCKKEKANLKSYNHDIESLKTFFLAKKLLATFTVQIYILQPFFQIMFLYCIEIYANTKKSYLYNLCVLNNRILKILQFKKRLIFFLSYIQCIHTTFYDRGSPCAL